MSSIQRTALILSASLCQMIAIDGSAAATTQEPDSSDRTCTSARSQGRFLEDHLFIPSQLVPGPFIDTYFNNVTAVGYGSTDVPVYDLSGNFRGTRSSGTAALRPSFELMFRLLPTLGLRLSLVETVIAGSTSGSLLGGGLVAAGALGGGVNFVARLARRTQLGFNLDFAYQPELNVSLVRPIVTSILNRTIDTSSILAMEHVYVIHPGIAGGFDIGPAAGLVVRVDYLHDFNGTLLATGRRKNDFQAAAVLDLDLDAAFSAPIGLTAAYRLDVPISGPASVGHAVDASLLFIGRKDLVLGVELNVEWSSRAVLLSGLELGNIPTDRQASTVVGLWQIVMRYYM
jgi:hypothetical protein